MVRGLAEDLVTDVQELERQFLLYCDNEVSPGTLHRVLQGFAMVKAGLIEVREYKRKEE